MSAKKAVGVARRMSRRVVGNWREMLNRPAIHIPLRVWEALNQIQREIATKWPYLNYKAKTTV